jgi:two-component system cell cycle response regulator
VEATRLGERARGKLFDLLSDDRADSRHLITRLKSLREMEGVPVFATALRFLSHLEMEDGEAERLLERVLLHRASIARTLGRDPGVRVAMMDFLSNVERRLVNPKIVEMADFEETARSASTDALTGLGNRRRFQEVLDREIRRSRRYRWPLTVVMLDLDHFKRVNDAYGHLLGDLVLARVGSVLRHGVREADVPCRFGGEEFALILPETERLGGYVVAGRVRRRVAEAFHEKPVGGHDVAMTVSAGLAVYPDDGLHASEIVARADEALYLAKRSGRDRVSVHHHEKRGALRFPPRAGTVVRFAGGDLGVARPVDLSRTGVLLETEVPPPIAAPVTLRLLRRGRRGDESADDVAGRIVRIAPERTREGRWLVGVAFDAPLSDDDLGTNVSLVRGAGRPRPRGRR